MASPIPTTYKNLKIRNKQSPIEIKAKLRKCYRDKVHSCRSLLLNSLRGVGENSIRSKLNEIYQSLPCTNEEVTTDEEEKLLAEIREELVQEELNWWLEEYEKSQNDIDWNLTDKDNVICPICLKVNFSLEHSGITCQSCNIVVRTEKGLSEIKKSIFSCIDKHNMYCSKNVLFTSIPDVNGTHIYLICSYCNDMQVVV